MDINYSAHRQLRSSTRNPDGESSSQSPRLKRSDSLPARLPSQPHEPEQVKTVRESITRPEPDRLPPEDFRRAGNGMHEGAENKLEHIRRTNLTFNLYRWLDTRILPSKDHMEFLKSVHPKFEKYNQEQKDKALLALGNSHPNLMAQMAETRNMSAMVPNSATSTRLMEPEEQKFLSRAMQRIHEDVVQKPFHIHGESGVLGNQNGEVTWFGHNSEKSISLPCRMDTRFVLHNHPPFHEPFTSSASKADHKEAAFSYLYQDQTTHYLTNGKDVMHIHPASMELVKLVPDPKLEQNLGQFPEAFRLPDPQQPPRPFSNHEAPAPFIAGWKPPEGWKPDPDYPRTEFFPKQKGEASGSGESTAPEADRKAANGKRPQEFPPSSPRPVKRRRFGDVLP